MGGETERRRFVCAEQYGSSPRGRGNPRTMPTLRPWHGFIPAWAGKPPALWLWSRPERVHPRVGGETRPPRSGDRHEQGSSPRGRGNRPGRSNHQDGSGFIPAWAGKPLIGCRIRAQSAVHPRVGGETACINSPTAWVWGSSPRGRGNREADVIALLGQRFIPAWAGKPRCPSPPTKRAWVHPRVGGETGWSRRCRKLA